jgi:hypothetical protein
VIRIRLALVAALALAGCKKEDAAPGRPPPIGKAERQRGGEACTRYVERLCACAEKKPERPELADRCQMKKAKPEALKLALEVDDDPHAHPQDIFLAQESARQVIAKCIEENAALDAECP